MVFVSSLCLGLNLVLVGWWAYCPAADCLLSDWLTAVTWSHSSVGCGHFCSVIWFPLNVFIVSVKFYQLNCQLVRCHQVLSVNYRYVNARNLVADSFTICRIAWTFLRKNFCLREKRVWIQPEWTSLEINISLVRKKWLYY